MANDDKWAELGHWSDVAGGLKLYLAYLIVLVSFTAVTVVASILIAMSGKTSALDSLMTLARISAIVGLGIAVLGLYALARYARVAPETGARGSAQTSLVLGLISFLIAAFGVIRILGASDIDAVGATTAIDIIGRIIGVVQFFALIISLRTVAGYIGRLDLHGLAGTVMLLAGITVALAVMSQLVASGRAAPMVLLLGIATLGIGIWCLVMLILLLTRLARAVMSDVQLPQAFS